MMNSRGPKRSRNEEQTTPPSFQRVTFQYTGDSLDIDAFITTANEEASGLHQGQHAIHSMRGVFCTGTHYVYLAVQQSNTPVFIQNVISKYCTSTGKRIQLDEDISLIRASQTNEVTLVISESTSSPHFWTWESSASTVAQNNIQPPTGALQSTTTIEQQPILLAQIIESEVPQLLNPSTSTTTDTSMPDSAPPPKPEMISCGTQYMTMCSRPVRYATKETMPLREWTNAPKQIEHHKDTYRAMHNRVISAEGALEDVRRYERERKEVNWLADVAVAETKAEKLEKQLEMERAENLKWRANGMDQIMRELETRNPMLFGSLNLKSGKTFTHQDYMDLAMRVAIFGTDAHVGAMDFLTKENVRLNAEMKKRKDTWDEAVRIHVHNLETRNAELEAMVIGYPEKEEELETTRANTLQMAETLKATEFLSEQRRVIMEQYQKDGVPEYENMKKDLAKAHKLLDEFRNADSENVEKLKMDGTLYSTLMHLQMDHRYFDQNMVHPLTELGKSYQAWKYGNNEIRLDEAINSVYDLKKTVAALEKTNADLAAKLATAEKTIKSRDQALHAYNLQIMKRVTTTPAPYIDASTAAATICNDITELHTLTKAARTELDTGFRELIHLRTQDELVRRTLSFIQSEKAGKSDEFLRCLTTIASKLNPKPLIPDKKK